MRTTLLSWLYCEEETPWTRAAHYLGATMEAILISYALAYNMPCCSIGIAEGSIEGFFPLSGIRSYEVLGRSIILATRYEALRHSLDIPGRGHVISLQESVYQSLNRDMQERFTTFEIDLNRFRIREDEKAARFHYCRIHPADTDKQRDEPLQKIS
ncbi:MAG: hypothetical protein ACOH5I_16790 [Oligoflexus sp.]